MSTINDEKIDVGRTETLVYSVEVQKAIDEVHLKIILHSNNISYILHSILKKCIVTYRYCQVMIH